MSKTVIIPSNTKPLWECEINGKKYAYASGSTATVPDEVAEFINNINAMYPKEQTIPNFETIPDDGVPGQYLERTESGMKWSDSPIPTSGDPGQVLTKTENGVVWEDPAGGDPLYMHIIDFESEGQNTYLKLPPIVLKRSAPFENGEQIYTTLGTSVYFNVTGVFVTSEEDYDTAFEIAFQSDGTATIDGLQGGFAEKTDYTIRDIVVSI